MNNIRDLGGDVITKIYSYTDIQDVFALERASKCFRTTYSQLLWREFCANKNIKICANSDGRASAVGFYKCHQILLDILEDPDSEHNRGLSDGLPSMSRKERTISFVVQSTYLRANPFIEQCQNSNELMDKILSTLKVEWSISPKANISCVRAFKTKNIITKGQVIDNIREHVETFYLRRKVKIADEWLLCLRGYLPGICYKKPLEVAPKIVYSMPCVNWPSEPFQTKKAKIL